MPRYALTVAYDGFDFCGWQKQEPLLVPSQAGTVPTLPINPDHILPAAETDTLGPGRVALRTVQAVLERAVREAVREPVILTGASRTDAGVHALGQVAAFTCSGEETDAPQDVPPPKNTPRNVGWPLSRGCDRLVKAINSRLPADVVVLGACPVAPAFDPVRWAIRKQYVYSFRISRHRAMFDRNRVFCVHDALDLDRMRTAVLGLVGTHDCVGLTTAHHGRQSTVRTIEHCTIEEFAANPPGTLPDIDGSAKLVQIRVCGNGFLYNMVRIIAGTLLDVGRNRLSEDVFDRVFATGDRRLAGQTLPPSGLCLEWIEHSMGDGPMAETGDEQA
jgi:tRNA pseudouridine38-40 synthase